MLSVSDISSAGAEPAMGGSLYVQAVHHELPPSRLERLEPRQRYVELQDDLHRLAGEKLDPQSLLSGDQYTYVELADALLTHVDPAALMPVDALVTSWWTPEYDPDFSALGPYLHHRLGLSCESFDVVDRGSISPPLALLVLKDYLSAGAATGSGLLLAVEQSTVPQPIEAHVPGPRRSSAGMVRVGRQQEGTGAELLSVRGLDETAVLEPGFRPQQFVADLCEQFAIARNELTVFVRRSTYMYRLWNHWAVGHAGAPRLRFLPAGESCMNLWSWLRRLPLDSAGTPSLFLDEDVDSLAAAAVLVRT